MSDIALINFKEKDKANGEMPEVNNVLHINVPSVNDGFNGENEIPKTPSRTRDPNSDRFSSAGTQSLCSEDLGTDFGLHQAAREGSADAIRLKLNQCESEGQDILRVIDAKDSDGLAALHHAAKWNRKEATMLLLDKGAYIDFAGGEDANTPLQLAAKYNCVAVARLLVSRGASINTQDIYGCTALHFSARRGNTEIAKLLLDQKNIDISIQDNGDITPLHQAAISGDVEITEKLIQHGADIHRLDAEGENAFHFAASEGNVFVLRCIIGTFGKDEPDGKPNLGKVNYVNEKSKGGDTALHLACTSGYEDCVKLLISQGADVNLKAEGKVSPLQLAAVNGSISVASELLSHKAKINSKDEDLMTPLHKASMFGKTDMIKFLLEKGSAINARDKDNYTPLLAAVWKGQTEAAKLLYEKGARMHTTDASLKTCIHLAVEYDHCDTLKMLMDSSAVGLVNSTDKDYMTALHYAALHGNVEALNILLENGAKEGFGDSEEKTPLHHAAEQGKPKCVLQLCKTPHSDLNATDENGRMPLHLAAMNGNIGVIRILVDMGSEIDGRDDTNWTPLDYAAKNGFYKSAAILLDNDAPVDAKDKNNNTPLHWAAGNGHMECVTLLLDNGADIALKDINGKNCLDFAIENNEQSVCMALVTHSRWREVLDNINKDGSNPMKKLIQFAPDIAEVVMNKCIEESKHTRNNKDFSISYDFHYIDVHPSLRSPQRVSLEPVTMAAYHREKLLSHPLTKRLIAYKWSKLGRPIYYLTLFIYMIFVACVTAMVVVERESDRNIQLAERNMSKYRKSTLADTYPNAFHNIIPVISLIICCLNLVKEVIQAVIQRRKYFSQGINYFEWALYISTMIFMIPFIFNNHSLSFEQKWNAGAISILLTWIEFLLFLSRFPYFGLYVVMFVEVLKTMVRVLLVFAIFIVGFALSFYVLMREQDTFSSVEKSLMKVSVMAIGEIEYDTILTGVLNTNSTTTNLPVMPMSGVTYAIFTIFLLLLPIIMMNLLVGLAVGDIEAVRKTAYIRILKQQVDILQDMERNYPTFIIKRAYSAKHVEYPNRIGYFEQLRKFLGYDDEYGYLKEEQEDQANNDEELRQKMKDHQHELIKQKRHIKHLKNIVKDQSALLRKIAAKIGVEEEDTE